MQKAYALFWGAVARIGRGSARGPLAAIRQNRLRATYRFVSFFARSCSSFSAIFISSPRSTGR